MSFESRFQISVPDDALALLQRKLADVRFPDELSDAGWDYGAPLADVKRLVNLWKDGYDWRAHERELNQLPMFTRDIEVEGFGILNIHYIHQRSELESAIPLLFVHGCTWNNHIFSESLTLCVELTRIVNRARQLSRGDENAAALDCNWGWPSIISCRGT
jgi:hypothetical protein